MLVVCNLAFARSSGWARWGWQLFGFGGLFFVYRIGGLSLGDIGLSRSRIGIGLKYALVAIAVSFVALVIAYFINQSLFRDTRYNQALGPALLASLFILPLKVVIFEELVFRGVMPALLKDLGSRPWVILVVSSILFGLWHISTTPKSGNITAGHYSNLLIVGAIFMVTSAAGAALYLLRYQSDSLVPAIAVHWFINGAAIVLASLAWS
ncbi:MAG TPA: CPBP family intramembrane glutamic endopeptidase [Candidatus Binatia bacterium]|nr:CPBP family intramembrane glutamic endopeptidase [Candidatus Binatia bacterium]